MKILIVSQYFWPENFKINDLCIELQKEDNEVVVLTGKPNYPSGKYYNGYKFWGFQSEYYENISIRRVPLFSRKNGSSKGIYESLNCGIGSNDDKSNVQKNLSIVSRKFNIEIKQMVLMNQTHSNKVEVVENKNH